MSLPFHAIIKPVGDVCNLNCTYCFYKEKSEEGSVMDLQTLDSLIKNYINEQPPSCKEVQFVWQGGEPMMAGLDFYEQAIALQHKYQRPDMLITNAIQTNGTFIQNKWVDFFKKHDFQVGISIDGNSEHHDQARIYYTGRDSHDRVIKGYNLLKNAGITTNILCVVHDDNIDEGKQIYRYFNQQLGATNIQFLPVVGDTSINPIKWGHFLTSVFDEWITNGLGRVSVQLFDATFTRIVHSVETFCVHAHECGRQLAVERNGSVYSCDHYVNDAHYLGNINTASFTSMLESAKQKTFTEQSSNHDAPCANCSVKGLCQSGCPRHRDTVGKNKLCEGYYEFFTYSAAYNYAIAESLRRKEGVQNYKKYLPAMKLSTKELFK